MIDNKVGVCVCVIIGVCVCVLSVVCFLNVLFFDRMSLSHHLLNILACVCSAMGQGLTPESLQYKQTNLQNYIKLRAAP